MSTIKLIDSNAIIKAAVEISAIITAENHNIFGGLGSAVAEVLVENHPVPMQKIGIQDVLNETAQTKSFWKNFGRATSI